MGKPPHVGKAPHVEKATHVGKASHVVYIGTSCWNAIGKSSHTESPLMLERNLTYENNTVLIIINHRYSGQTMPTPSNSTTRIP